MFAHAHAHAHTFKPEREAKKAQNDSQEYPPILENGKFPRIDVTECGKKLLLGAIKATDSFVRVKVNTTTGPNGFARRCVLLRGSSYSWVLANKAHLERQESLQRVVRHQVIIATAPVSNVP